MDIIKKVNVYNYDFDTEKLKEQYALLLEGKDVKEHYSDELNIDNGKYNDRIGFLADEIKTILPNLVIEDENGYLSINYVELVPVLVSAINDLEKKVAFLETEIDNLKNK
ncbi:MAG: hypothetical protein R2771_02555 [Saprospiraceae bacterium]